MCLGDRLKNSLKISWFRLDNYDRCCIIDIVARKSYYSEVAASKRSDNLQGDVMTDTEYDIANPVSEFRRTHYVSLYFYRYTPYDDYSDDSYSFTLSPDPKIFIDEYTYQVFELEVPDNFYLAPSKNDPSALGLFDNGEELDIWPDKDKGLIFVEGKAYKVPEDYQYLL